MNDRDKNSIQLARCDLALALDYTSGNSGAISRFRQTIRLLTDVLDDWEEFNKLQTRWWGRLRIGPEPDPLDYTGKYS